MNDEIYTGVLKASEELKHYGVLGMKWGVRKNPDKAYSKSIKKLRKIDKAKQKASTDRAKITATNYQKRIAKLERRTSSAVQTSANLSRKSASLEIKSRKLGSRAEKLQSKSDKARTSAAKAWTLKSYNRRLRRSDKLHAKSEKLGIKSERLGVKSKDLGLQAQLYAAKSKKYATKVANLKYNKAEVESNAAKMEYKQKKLQAKGEKWVKAMNKHFANVALSSVSSEDIEYGKKWAVEIASRTAYSEKKMKHSGISEELKHYGVKGMKWGVHKAQDKITGSKSSPKGRGITVTVVNPSNAGGGADGSLIDDKKRDEIEGVLKQLGLSGVIGVGWDDEQYELTLTYKGTQYPATDKNLTKLIKLIKTDNDSKKSEPHNLPKAREKNIDTSKTTSVKKRKSYPYSQASGTFEDAVKNSPNYRKSVQQRQTNNYNTLKQLSTFGSSLKKRRKKS